MEDEALYRSCREHGSEQQKQAYTIIWNELYRIALYFFRNIPDGEESAADCVQDTMIKIDRKIDQCRNPAQFRSWIKTILRNTVLDKLDTLQRHKRQDLLAENDPHLHTPPPALPKTQDLKTFLLEAIQPPRVSEQSQRVIIGKFFSSQKDGDLASSESQVVGKTLTAANIRVIRTRNMKKLRDDPNLRDRLREFLD